MSTVSKEELKIWKMKSLMFLLAVEFYDYVYRKKHCHMCTQELKQKRKCREACNDLRICDSLIRARERNKALDEMQLHIILQSPLVKQSHLLGEIAKAFYGFHDA